MLRDALLLGLAGGEQLVVVQVCRPVAGSFRSRIHKMVEVVDTGILPFGPCSLIRCYLKSNFITNHDIINKQLVSTVHSAMDSANMNCSLATLSAPSY